MKYTFLLKKTFVISLITLFWILVIGGFLITPRLLKWFQDSRTLNVITWTDMIDPQIIKAFERETGIKVTISYFDSNEELYVKLLATEGEGYDLVLPSDFTAQNLIAHNIMQPIDKTQLTIWNSLDERLLNHYFDPENIYTIPYYYAIYGIGIDTPEVRNAAQDWNLVFEPNSSARKIAMINNAREAILITALYLFGSIEHLDTKALDEIQQTLLAQKKLVEAYTDLRADYLLSSGTCPLVVTTSPFMHKVLLNNSNLDFVVPSKSFMIIDSFAIPRLSTKQAIIYKFLNYLYQPEIIKHHFYKYTYFPATNDLVPLLKESNAHESIIKAHQSLQSLDFFRNILSEHSINTIWLAVKAQ